MANYFPTLVTPGDGMPPVAVEMANGYTYNTFIASLDAISYLFTYLMITGGTAGQVKEDFSFKHKDANGNDAVDVIPYAPDPYEISPTVQMSFGNKQYLLDGQVSLNFDLLPNEAVQMHCILISFNPADLLNNVKVKNGGFLFVNDIQNFFTEYRDAIEDEPNDTTL